MLEIVLLLLLLGVSGLCFAWLFLLLLLHRIGIYPTADYEPILPVGSADAELL